MISPKNHHLTDTDMEQLCENCWYFVTDEESGEGFCDLQLDEDEYARMLQSPRTNGCKYFRPDVGEYGIVRKQN